MSDEKFTQGEWRTNQRPHGKVSIVGDNGQQVCLMWNSKERDANCNLISAAPDMYRALRDVAGEIPVVANNHRGYAITLTQAEVDAIRETLGKADGEQA